MVAFCTLDAPEGPHPRQSERAAASTDTRTATHARAAAHHDFTRPAERSRANADSIEVGKTGQYTLICSGFDDADATSGAPWAGSP